MKKNKIIDLITPIVIKKPSVLLAEKILDLIINSVLKIGDQLPSEEDLSEYYGLKPSSVKKALEILSRLGIVKVLPGGTKIIENSKKRTQSSLPNKKNFVFFYFNQKDLKDKKYKIGFSQTTLNHPARIFMDNSFHNYANEMKITGITKDANWFVEKERENIFSLLNQGIDGLIISTHFQENLKIILEEINKYDIPIVIFASGEPIEKLPFNVWACTNEWQQGRIAGYFMCMRIGGEGEVGQILGSEHSSVTEARSDGILTALDDFPGVKIIKNISTNWQRDTSEKAAIEMIKNNKKIKAIITHCDEQAIGAANAVKKLNRNKGEERILIFSVSDCQKECFDMIKSREIELTQNYEQDGSIALNIMLQLLERLSLPKLINLGTSFVTIDTINNFKPNF